MIALGLTVADLGQLRFAYSPLAETTKSLHLLASGHIPRIHRDWFTQTRHKLPTANLHLLLSAIPPHPYIADFLLAGAASRHTTIDQQLHLVANTPPDHLHHEFRKVWPDTPPPPVIQKLTTDPTGAQQLADELWNYWSIAIEPHWRNLRALYDDDLAYRATELTTAGITAMLTNLHPHINIHGDHLHIHRLTNPHTHLTTTGVILVPSAFTWPNLILASTPGAPTSLTYPARGIAHLWTHHPKPPHHDALSALLGRSRATILTTLTLPHSTTELALKLNQSPPAISQHLSILKRSGLVDSWRTGRSVLYRRTPLGTSIITTDSLTTDDTSAPTNKP